AKQLLRVKVAALVLLLTLCVFETAVVSALPSYDSPDHPGCSACHIRVTPKTASANVEPNTVMPGASFNVNASIPNPDDGVTGAKIDVPKGFAASNVTQGPAVVNNYSWNVSASSDAAPGVYWLYAYLVAGTPEAGYAMTAAGSVTIEGPADNPVYISSVNIEPQFPQPSDRVRVNAYITDAAHTLTNTTLHYRYEGTEYAAPMNVDTTNTYVANIGPFANKTFVDYWVVARDDAGYAVKSSNRGFLIGQPSRVPDTYLLVSGFVLVDAACVAVLYRVAKIRKKREP
ncbi:MAG: hypothetical protein LUP95_06525, partial [Euryarchaeota archaeon]|nr:hypothetical protein [Euryarchaeota archaeon]